MNQDRCCSRVAVVGAGRMGTGISLSFAFSGFTIQLFDSEERTPEEFSQVSRQVYQDIETELGLLQKLQLITSEQAQVIGSRISVLARSESAEQLGRADFIFEAVAEILKVKQATYAWLNTVVASSAIIGSTTSTMLVDTLAEFVDNNSRFLNTHWLNPALLMPLIEMSPGKASDEQVVAAMKGLLESIGKQPIICKASPGFIVPRIQALAMTEAARCVEEGVASAEDVDKAIRIGFGVRYAVLGLLEFIDWGGGDIVYLATKYLAANLDDKRFSIPDIIDKNMRENRNGIRDGEGFYNYQEIDVEEYRQKRMGEFIGLLQYMSLLPKAK